jgi:hypothetical protein
VLALHVVVNHKDDQKKKEMDKKNHTQKRLACIRYREKKTDRMLTDQKYSTVSPPHI